HPEGKSLDLTAPERYVFVGADRRKADRVIWAGLGRLPKKTENPTIAIEFVSKGKQNWVRDYVVKREEYERVGLKEYWIIDRFQRIMTVYRQGLEGALIVKEGEIHRTPLLPGFELDFAKLLALADRW